MDTYTLYHRAVECWAERVNAVGPEQWSHPTPCAAWDVRDLVNHVVVEDLWTTPLVDGLTMAEVGDRFEGDQLGEDPITAALAAAAEAMPAVAASLPDGAPVQLSYGEEHPEEYVRQLAADHLVHSWDLAVATGQDARLDPGLVHEVAVWFADREEAYRGAGAIGARVGSAVDAQGALLSAFGRDASWGPNHACLARLSAAFGRGDVAAISGLMAGDCVFEATGPAPDGARHEGAAAVGTVWAELFGSTRDAAFTEEESFVSADRGVLRWRFEWTEPDGSVGHVRGVDVLRFRDGLVAEKLSYVKG